MTTLTIKSDQKPTEEALRRLSELKDEDIVYDDDCPETTSKMEKAIACAAAQRSRENKNVMEKTNNCDKTLDVIVDADKGIDLSEPIDNVDDLIKALNE